MSDDLNKKLDGLAADPDKAQAAAASASEARAEIAVMRLERDMVLIVCGGWMFLILSSAWMDSGWQILLGAMAIAFTGMVGRQHSAGEMMLGVSRGKTVLVRAALVSLEVVVMLFSSVSFYEDQIHYYPGGGFWKTVETVWHFAFYRTAPLPHSQSALLATGHSGWLVGFALLILAGVVMARWVKNFGTYSVMARALGERH